MPSNESDLAAGSAPPADAEKAAILVIHGIGEQQPYQTLDAFVQGVAREFGIVAGQLEYHLVSSKIGTLSFIRMPLPPSRATPRGGARTLDFYEFHWAGMVEGRIGFRQVLGWLARTALNPLLLWAQQVVVLQPLAGSKPNWRRNMIISLLGELVRAISLLVVAAAVIAPFAYTSTHPQALIDAWDRLRQAIPDGRSLLTLAALIVTALLVVATARGGIELIQRWRKGAGTERAAVDWWASTSIATAALLTILAFAADRVFELHAGELLRNVGQALRPWPVLLPLLAALVAIGLGKVLVSYLGDVTLYTAADENSTYYRTRTAILKRSTELVRHLCEEGGYGGVSLAGHSLGSVIAYDTIDKYLKDTNAGVAPAGSGIGVERLRGLLTFGSPLDAVYYFFRTQVGPQEPVRAQILSALHGFRRQTSGRDYGPFKLAPYKVLGLDQCRWLNVYSPMDLISRRLVFYKVDDQVGRRYPLSPIRAHLAYWQDRGFYKLVVSWL
jgi:hypothetical protein